MTGAEGNVQADPQAPTAQLAPGPVEQYLAGVRAALADLPAHEVAEILDDVRAHLADLAGELDGDPDLAALTARLGTPAAYAAELRAAAGYPAPPAPAGAERSGSGAARLALVGLVGSTLLIPFGVLVRELPIVLFGVLVGLLALPLLGRDGPRVPSVAALPVVRRLRAARPEPGTAAGAVADFLASLQPAWWVVRAFAAAVFALAVLGTAAIEGALLLTVLAVPVSVWVGHRTRRDRRWLWAVVPLNGLAVALLLAAPPAVAFGSPQPDYSYSQVYQPGLWQDSERQISDIRPVDSAGNPLTGVYLFDQDGVPIDVSGSAECGYDDEPDRMAGDRPYPRGTLEYDRDGNCVLVPPSPLVAAVPSVPPTPTATPTSLPGVPTPGAVTPPPVTPPPVPSAPAVPAPPTR